MNLADLLSTTAVRHAHRAAVTDLRSGRSLTYGDLARETERVAAFLGSHGVERGDRIGLLAPNGLAYLPAAFGLLARGACLVPLASTLTPTEAAQVGTDVELNGCLSWPMAEPMAQARDGAVLSGGECDGFTFTWMRRSARGPAEFQALDPAFVRFTSGTTAQSKGVVLSHEGTLARVEAADRVLHLTEDDRVFWVLPLAYHFAVTIVGYVRVGAHVLLCPDTLPHALVDQLRRHAPTVLYAAPLHFERLGSVGSGEPLPGVRVCLSTSAPIAASVMERFEAVYGVPVGQAYGIIEAGLPCINPRTDGVPATSVGRTVPGYEVAVFAEHGTRAAPGASGEIAVRGDGLFSAYYAPWQRRDQVMRNGWFMTGDIGRQDDTGALYLEGRTKTVIFVAGLKFFPEEVEHCINQFAGVAESRVFARRHPRLGEVPCAEIVPAGERVDLEALTAHCVRALSPYKVPIDFTVVPAVPRTAGGKIVRRALR